MILAVTGLFLGAAALHIAYYGLLLRSAVSTDPRVSTGFSRSALILIIVLLGATVLGVIVSSLGLIASRAGPPARDKTKVARGFSIAGLALNILCLVGTIIITTIVYLWKIVDRWEVALESRPVARPVGQEAPRTERLAKWMVLGKQGGCVNALLFTADGKRLIVGSGGRSSLGPRGVLGVWDVEKLKLLHDHLVNASYEAFALTPDGKYLIALERYQVDIWDAQVFEPVGKIGGAWKAMALSPDGRTVALVDYDDGDDVHLFDVKTGKKQRVLPGCYSSVAFSPDGKTLAAGEGVEFVGGSDILHGTGTVYFWDTATWRKQDLPDPAPPVHMLQRWSVDLLTFSPDGASFFVTGYRSRVWDARRHVVRHTFHFPVHVEGAAFTSNGTLLATAAYSELALWDARDFTKLAEKQAHDGGVWSVAFSPDGKLLASGGNFDSTVILWKVRGPGTQPGRRSGRPAEQEREEEQGEGTKTWVASRYFQGGTRPRKRKGKENTNRPD